MTDLIISAIANYTPDKIKHYVNSIDKCGFAGDKIMVTYNVPNDTISFLEKNGWEVAEGTLHCHPHMNRLIDIYYILKSTDKDYRFVVTTDVRDVVFQSNPSKYLEEHLTKKILVSSENVLYKDEPWGVKNILEGYGPLYLNEYQNQISCNVGVIAGYKHEMMNLLLLNYLVSQAGNTTHFTDQSSFNFIIHNELIKPVIQIEGIETNWTLQLGTLPNQHLIGKYEVKIKDDKVMHDSKPFVIVHQYDREPALNRLITQTYA